MIDTGLRVGEAINLDWSSAKLRDSPASVRVRPVHSKSSKPRTVPLTPRAKGVLESKKERAGLVFRGVDSTRLSRTWLAQQHAAVRKTLAFPEDFVLHSLRHTFGTRLGETGADAFTIMELMGHSSITVSQKYVHPSTESKRLAIERLAGAVVPTKSPTAIKFVGGKKAAST